MTIQNGKPVLIVEDDLDIAESLAAALESAGYTTLTATDGKAALEILRRGNTEVCLILLDLMMPVMDGWEFRARQKTDPSLSGIPIVILSAGGKGEEKGGDVGGCLLPPKAILPRYTVGGSGRCALSQERSGNRAGQLGA